MEEEVLGPGGMTQKEAWDAIASSCLENQAHAICNDYESVLMLLKDRNKLYQELGDIKKKLKDISDTYCKFH